MQKRKIKQKRIRNKKVKVPRMGVVKDALKTGLKAGGEKLIEVGAALATKKAHELLGRGVALVK